MTVLKSFILIPLVVLGICLGQDDCLSPVEIHGALSVNGNQVVNAEGEPAVMAGNSFFWSNVNYGGERFYNREVVEYLASDWNTSIVRAAMGVEDPGGYLDSPAHNLARTKALIDAAIDYGLYVIVDWHSHHAENHTAQAVSFFTQIASEYGDHPNIIYEVYNEPIYSSWSNDVKPYAEAVIDAIRAEDPDNLIIVGSPTWSQDVDVVAGDPITGETNIAYTIHFYAGTHGESLRNKCRVALDAGLALFCTEWGTVNADGNGAVAETSTETWIAFLQENGISHCNWAVNDKAEGASIFKPNTSPTGGWSDSDLTASGLLVKSIVQDWGIGCNDGGPPPEIAWERHFTPAPAGDITMEFSVIEDWGNGFNGQILITNNGAPINGYTMGFTSSWAVVNVWNEVPYSQSGNNYTLDTNGHDWIGNLATGQSQTIGFTANGAATPPTNYLFNGSPLTSGDNGNISYEAWRSQYNLDADTSDADSDGYPDLTEFLLGTNPGDKSSRPHLQLEITEENSETRVNLSFRVNPLAENVEYRFQTSTDLVNWDAREGDTALSPSSELIGNDGMINVVWKSDQPISTIGEKFFTRLQVRETP